MSKNQYTYFMAYFPKKSIESIINEENETYKIKPINNIHDKLFRSLLGDKKELSEFLNKYLKIQITSNELKKYNSSFITNRFQNLEADTVYKIKDKKVFILIEHQSRIDNTMPFRILKYNTEIINDTNDLDLCKNQDYIYAKVIPIVIYTGSKKWNVSKKFSTQQAQFGNQIYLELKYNLIDINSYSKKMLLEGKTMIEKAMLIEKAKNEKELLEIIENILGKIDYNDEIQINKMKKMLIYALAERLGKEKVAELVEQLNKKNEKRCVSMLHERLAAERIKMKKEAKAEGRAEGQKDNLIATIRRMVEFGEKEDKIELYTGANKNQISQVKKMLHQNV